MQSFNWSMKLSRKKLYYVIAALAVLCLFGVMNWKGHNRPQTVAEEITVVRTAVAGAAEGAQGYTYSGEVRGRYESQLAFQVNGKIVKRRRNEA
jgi:multidrug efflux system membrane fusion protein